MPDKWDLSLLDGGTPGLHLTINPQKPAQMKVSPTTSSATSPQVKSRPTMNPFSPLPPSDPRPLDPKITQIFQQHGLRLKGHELQSLTAGREKGVKSILAVLNKLGAYQILKPDDREKLANKLADFLMAKSLQGQLSRTVPTLLEQNEQKTEKLQHIFRQANPPDGERGGIQDLIKKIPVGVSIKIHLPVDWL